MLPMQKLFNMIILFGISIFLTILVVVNAGCVIADDCKVAYQPNGSTSMHAETK